MKDTFVLLSKLILGPSKVLKPKIHLQQVKLWMPTMEAWTYLFNALMEYLTFVL
jgi:hypothetical protein